MDSTATLHEEQANYGTPVPEEVLQMARDAVKNFHECFWWWDETAPLTTRDDVREVIRNLRMSGGHRAWWTAQKIHKCL